MLHMNRRTFLSTGLSGLAGLGAGTILLNESTETAQAAVSVGKLTMQGASATTQEGWIEDVTATVSGNWKYELPGGSPQQWVVDLQVSDGETWVSIGQDSGSLEYNMMDGEYTVSGSLITDGPFQQDMFSAPGPGKSTITEMPFQIWFRVLGTDETKLANATVEDTATITVGQKSINATQYGEVGGSGDVSINTP